MAMRTPRELLVLLLSIVRQGLDRIADQPNRENPDTKQALDAALLHLDTPPCRFQNIYNQPSLPLRIPDEILDYYGWVFCQGGFLNLQMTFEQFLTVAAAFKCGVRPEYDESESVQTSD